MLHQNIISIIKKYNNKRTCIKDSVINMQLDYSLYFMKENFDKYNYKPSTYTNTTIHIARYIQKFNIAMPGYGTHYILKVIENMVLDDNKPGIKKLSEKISFIPNTIYGIRLRLRGTMYG